jgi:hypothetical protein
MVFWEETYARVKKTDTPNEMWQKRPRSQLIKCGKAAALRAAFPEEAGEYTAEEMEGKIIEADGVPVHSHAAVSAADAGMVSASTPKGEAAPAATMPRAPLREVPQEPTTLPASDPADAPPQAADRQALLDDHIKAHVAALVTRASAARAWESAEEYARSRFNGEHLTYALAELGKAAAAAVAQVQAGATAENPAVEEAKAA